MTALILLSDWQKSQIEFWRKTEFEGYEVSNHGRMRSWYNTHKSRRERPLILKPLADKHRYAQIKLFNAEGKRCSGAVHRLVAIAFVPNPNNHPCVNHLTGLKGDNRAAGLEWTTRAGNSQHAWAHGLHKRDRFALARKMVEARKGLYDVPDVLVLMIRNMLADGVSQGQIRRWSGLKALTIQGIAVGRTYRDVA